MRSKIGILTIVFLAVLLIGCEGKIGSVDIVRGSGNVVTESRDVSGFTTVVLDGAGKLVIDNTGSESLTITADDNLLDYIDTSVQNGRLIIRIKGRTTFSGVKELSYHVTVDELAGVELNGAGNVTVNDVDTEDWSVELNGVGGVTASGEAIRQTVNISGAGNYEAPDLASQETTVDHEGAGRAVVQASDRLDVTIDGLGTVEYIGNPEVTKEINGLGSVQQR